jgi:hypothetical protein
MSEVSAPAAQAADALWRQSATAKDTDIMAMTVSELAAADEISVARKAARSL